MPIISTLPPILFQWEVANPLDWSFDVHLIEIDNIHTVVYSNIELNGTVLKAKQDTEAQINVLSKTVFQTLQKDCKLPLYPKTCVKLVGYGNKVVNYLGTTKIKCIHNGTETEGIFYITDVPDTKIILGLQLCIDLGLIVIQCDDECKCKNVQVAEASLTPILEMYRNMMIKAQQHQSLLTQRLMRPTQRLILCNCTQTCLMESGLLKMLWSTWM